MIKKINLLMTEWAWLTGHPLGGGTELSVLGAQNEILIDAPLRHMSSCAMCHWTVMFIYTHQVEKPY